jgi:hypothetical protein
MNLHARFRVCAEEDARAAGGVCRVTLTSGLLTASIARVLTEQNCRPTRLLQGKRRRGRLRGVARGVYPEPRVLVNTKLRFR